MTRKRKTIEVEAVKAAANHMLANSLPELTEGRTSVAVLLERVLMDTGNYRGFMFTDGAAGEVDETRRRYH